jgi:hypothetical protein
MSIITNTPVGLPKLGRTTSSYWLQDGANPLAKHGASDNLTHQNVDVVIIGSCITGISAAYHLVQGLKTDNLSRAGDFRIVVLEARDFCKSDRGAGGQLTSSDRFRWVQRRPLHPCPLGFKLRQVKLAHLAPDSSCHVSSAN